MKWENRPALRGRLYHQPVILEVTFRSIERLDVSSLNQAEAVLLRMPFCWAAYAGKSNGQ